MHTAVAMFVLFMAPSQLPAEFVSLLTPLEYAYTGGGYDNRLFHYRLFVPIATDSAEKRPLIVWLHGLGEAGDDNVHHLRWLNRLIFLPPLKPERYPFFLLAVQCPHDNPAWTRNHLSAGDDMIDVASAILEQTLRDFPIDPERVYLAGLSTGGSGCWEFATRYPEFFAAVAPLASAGGNNLQVRRLTNIPIWAFHSNQDAGTPIRFVRSTVQALKEADGNVHLTEIESTSHESWKPAFDDYHLLDWLLSQRRGQASSSPAPGTIALRRRLQDFAKGWQWWQILLQVAVPTILLVAIAKVITQRRRAIARSRLASSSTSNLDALG
jgi:predicted esterase